MKTYSGASKAETAWSRVTSRSGEDRWHRPGNPERLVAYAPPEQVFFTEESFRRVVK